MMYSNIGLSFRETVPLNGSFESDLKIPFSISIFYFTLLIMDSSVKGTPNHKQAFFRLCGFWGLRGFVKKKFPNVALTPKLLFSYSKEIQRDPKKTD